jgi:hypothetical protein
MKNVTPTSVLLNPHRQEAFRRSTVGDVLNAIGPGLEAAGFELADVCDEGFLVRLDEMHTLLVEFRTRPVGGVVPPSDEPDPDDRVVPLSDPSWTDDDGFWEPTGDDTFPSRRESRDADTTLSPTEQDWKEQLAPFSRNQRSPLDPHLLLGIRHALESYERLRRIL